MTERIALDTRYWRTPQQATENTASLFIEQKKGPLPERINYTELFLDPDGDLYHPAFGKLKDGIEVKTEIDKLELKATDRLSKWAGDNDFGQAIWISPPYPGQDESRFIVYDLQEIGGKKKIALHAICGNQNSAECIDIAQQIMVFSGDNFEPIDSETHLRENPIPFNPSPFYPSWVDLLKEVIYPPEIWEEIRAGNHIRNKDKLLQISAEKIQIVYQDIASANTDFDHIILGAKLEQSFQDVGYAIQQKGPCGISNTQALQNLRALGINTNSAFTLMSEGLPALETSFPCPKCQGPIPSGRGITICPHCGITKEEYKSKCD